MQLAHAVAGNENAPLVVFLHGFLGSREDWRGAVESIEGRYRCLSIDLPGHGESVGLVEGECTMPAAATAVIDLVDSYDAASFSIVGYSMGGRLALYLASIYAMRIDALVIESASPGLKTNEERTVRRAQDERWARMLEDDGMGPFLDAWYRQTLFASIASRPELLDRVKSSRAQNDPRELARALRGMGVANHAPLWEEWRANHIPSLVVAGALDAKYCGIAREMGDTCGAATCTIIPGAGHNVHEEAPDAYNRVITAFLDSVV